MHDLIPPAGSSLSDHRLTARHRIVFHVAIGIDRRLLDFRAVEAAFADLDAKLTRVTGGVLRFTGRGTWTLGSECDSFTGPIERDTTYNYILSVLPELEDIVYKSIKAAVSETIQAYALPADHIHVARFQTEERIFRVSAGTAPGAVSSA